MSIYRKTHILSKLIVCILVVILMILGRVTNFIVLDIIAIVIWFFGVNLIGWLIEEAKHIKHNHKPL